MKTLILKHNGHEAHVPYELPVGDWFDVFVPDHGICNASVLLRTEDIRVEEVTPKDQGPLPDAIPDAENHPAVLEQAGDVCAVFERALGALARMGDSGPSRALDSALAKMFPQTQEDAKVLSTIAEMALLESDMNTLYSRLPCDVADTSDAPPSDWLASRWLNNFIVNVLVPRAQDMATAAAKRREAEWNEEQAQHEREAAYAFGDDLAIDLAKERA